MILRLDRPLVCFDLESTGLDVEKDRIVEIGLVELSPDGRREHLQMRFDPGIDIPENATRVHGIRNADVRGLFGEPPLGKAGGELLEFIGEADLAGFNALDYDLPLWLNECERHGLGFPIEGRMLVDAKIIFDAMEPGWDRFIQGPRNLNNAVLHYCGRAQATQFSRRDSNATDEEWTTKSLDEQHRHSAVLDAEATLDVLMSQLERYPDLPRDVRGLHEFCQRAAERRATAG